MLEKTEAIACAYAWCRDQSWWQSTFALSERHAETDRSWLFLTTTKEGGPIYGTAYIAVSKASGDVSMCQEAWREFVEKDWLWLRFTRRLARFIGRY